MRAREWAIVGTTCEPAAYGIPDLPTWRVDRDERGGIAFAADDDDDDEPFILAESPVRVRR